MPHPYSLQPTTTPKPPTTIKSPLLYCFISTAQPPSTPWHSNVIITQQSSHLEQVFLAVTYTHFIVSKSTLNFTSLPSEASSYLETVSKSTALRASISLAGERLQQHCQLHLNLCWIKTQIYLTKRNKIRLFFSSFIISEFNEHNKFRASYNKWDFLQYDFANGCYLHLTCKLSPLSNEARGSGISVGDKVAVITHL